MIPYTSLDQSRKLFIAKSNLALLRETTFNEGGLYFGFYSIGM